MRDVLNRGVMEISVIVVCATCIIITFFIYLLFRDKHFKGGVEYDIKSGTIKVNKDNKDIKIDENIVSVKNILEIKEHSKEFIKAIVLWKKDIIIYLLEKIEKNHISEKTQSEFYTYVNEIKEVVIQKLEHYITNSKIDFNLSAITSDTYIQRLIRDTFYSVYEIYKTQKENTQLEALKIILIFLQDITLIIYERFLND